MVAALAACTEPRTPSVAVKQVTPACPRGPFAAQLDALLPNLAVVAPVALLPMQSLDKKIEPGCVIGFRKEPDDRLLDVGRVVARTSSRTHKEKGKIVGRGRLELGRRMMRLRLHDVAGDESLVITIDGAHVTLKEKGSEPFDNDVYFDDTAPLPLPLDALVASLADCGSDERLGRTEDGNVIAAKRGSLALWRSRWIDATQAAIIDTSFACSDADARLMWRTAVGDVLPMLAVASARSDRVLVIVRQGASETEDMTDYGFAR